MQILIGGQIRTFKPEHALFITQHQYPWRREDLYFVLSLKRFHGIQTIYPDDKMNGAIDLKALSLAVSLSYNNTLRSYESEPTSTGSKPCCARLPCSRNYFFDGTVTIEHELKCLPHLKTNSSYWFNCFGFYKMNEWVDILQASVWVSTPVFKFRKFLIKSSA